MTRRDREEFTMPVSTAVYYPTSDGKPMAETELHREIMVALIHALQQYFKQDPQVYVGGNMLFYYEEGDPRASCSPDVFFVRGVPKRLSSGLREIYKVWEEGKAPDMVIELTSKSTKMEDLAVKKLLYAELGVKEYFLFDPLKHYLPQPFIGFRLEDGEYVRMEPSRGRLRSDVTGLELGVLHGWLRLFDPETGEPLLTPDEEAEERERQAAARRKETVARAKAEQSLKASEDARKALEQEVERLRAELKRRNRE
jgi:Uma2 family endonuclease